MNFFKNLVAKIEVALNKNKEKEIYKEVIKTVIAIDVAKPVPEIGPFIPHPAHAQKLDIYKKYIDMFLVDHPNVKEITISFGDSLTDAIRDQLTSIDLNFSLSGSWSNQVVDMMEAIVPILISKDLYRKVKNVVIGTPGGNPLLMHQEINSVISQATICFNKCRELFPNPLVRVIVYGLPPCVSDYATANAITYNNFMIDWTMKDINSVYVFLYQKFGGGFLNLFPMLKFSVDGVHFNKSGALGFNDLINKAKRGLSKRMEK